MALSLPASISLEADRKTNWKVFAILWIACVAGFVAVLPNSAVLQSEVLRSAQSLLPLVLLVVHCLEKVVLFAAVGGFGYLMAAEIGLGLPFVEGWVSGHPVWRKLPRLAMVAAALGVLASVVIGALDTWIFMPGLQTGLAAPGPALPQRADPPVWQGVLDSLYGGIAEETLLRLGLLSFFAWLGRFVSRTTDNRTTLPVLWAANILAAVLFGLGQLPAAAVNGVPITPLVIARAVVSNGVPGVVAGWLYWRWGLESAIVAHFSGGIVLQVLIPLVSA